VHPQVMRAYPSTPHTSTLETPNFLMLGQKTWVPDHLTYHVPDHENSVHKYVGKLVKCMRVAYAHFARSNGRCGERILRSPPLLGGGLGLDG